MRLSESLVGHLGAFYIFSLALRITKQSARNPPKEERKGIQSSARVYPTPGNRRMAIERGSVFGVWIWLELDIDVFCVGARNLADIPACLGDGM